MKFRWWGAIAGLAIGVFDITLSQILHVDFRYQDQNITLYIFFYLASSFAAFGWTVGRLFEAFKGERKAKDEAKQRTEEIAETRVRLAQTEKLASLGQLASAVAHEVRNPLAIIRSSVQ